MVTHHRLEQGPDGSLHPAAELPEPLIVRPTSETIIGRSFAKWINSYRDLPLLINQWATSSAGSCARGCCCGPPSSSGRRATPPTPPRRRRSRRPGGCSSVYRDFTEELLAIPVIAGEKPEYERFPGAEITPQIEAMMQDGKALQCGTSHYLGQNFSEAMEMEFTDEDGERKLCYTTSWGLTTRMIGAVVMTHGDDNGLRVPPRIAPQPGRDRPDHQGRPDGGARGRATSCRRSSPASRGTAQPVRVEVDARDRKPAEKRWEWIRKGVPIVIELGERDIEQGVVTVTRRDDPELARDAIPREGAAEAVVGVLGDIQMGYFEEASERLRERTRDDITTLEEFREFFSGEDTDSGGFVRAPWSEEPETDRDDGRARRQRPRHPLRCGASAGRPLRDHRRPRHGGGDLRQGVLRAPPLTKSTLIKS